MTGSQSATLDPAGLEMRASRREDPDLFRRFESEVRTYCRSFPDIFAKGRGAWMETIDGRRVLDLLSGAGSLNYGHNDPLIVDAIVEHLRHDGIVQSLDLHTAEKARFIDAFVQIVLEPRGLDYKLQFPGPTGTNAVEASLKIARVATGRRTIAAFQRGFHGMTLGALAATANERSRSFAGIPLGNVDFWPYDGDDGHAIGSVEAIAERLETCREEDKPAAAILEVVQGEGGLRCATPDWLRALSALLKAHGVLLIVDDIQAGCGRTGTFFSFEPAGIAPDIVLLSKSLSGFGSPLALVLLAPALDVWMPGAHNGTFRGNNLAFIGARTALEAYWRNDDFAGRVRANAEYLNDRLERIAGAAPEVAVRGRGLMRGLEFGSTERAGKVSQCLYRSGVMAETCGPEARTLKLLPPLTISADELELAADGLERAVHVSLQD